MTTLPGHSLCQETVPNAPRTTEQRGKKFKNIKMCSTLPTKKNQPCLSEYLIEVRKLVVKVAFIMALIISFWNFVLILTQNLINTSSSWSHTLTSALTILLMVNVSGYVFIIFNDQGLRLSNHTAMYIHVPINIHEPIHTMTNNIVPTCKLLLGHNGNLAQLLPVCNTNWRPVSNHTSIYLSI